MNIASMHRIGARSEWFSEPPSVGSVASIFSIDNVGSDCQHRLRVKSMAVCWQLSEFAHESCHQPRSKLVHAIVVVPKFRKLPFRCVVSNKACLVPNNADSCITYR